MTLLIWTVAGLGVVLCAGLALAVLHLRRAGLPGRLTVQGAAHGLGGLAGTSLLVAALRQPHATLAANAAKMGAAGFGPGSAGLLILALLGGLAILLANLRRRRVPGILIAMHGLVAITGYTLLVAYVSFLP